MTSNERQRLIARYTAGYQKVVDALRGIGADELDFRPAPDEWSVREIVHHLADSETIAGQRLRQLLVDDDPRIHGYDQDAYARRLHYQRRALEPALQAFEESIGGTLEQRAERKTASWRQANGLPPLSGKKA